MQNPGCRQRTAGAAFPAASRRHGTDAGTSWRQKGDHGHGTPAAGTREWEGTYPARPRHVRDARHTAGQFLADGARADETLLICSELTTSSVLHSRSRDDGKFILRVTVHAEYIWIECEDAGGPWLARPGDGRPHGLDVVHALCGEDGWGVEDLDGGRTGRVVWARLGLDRSGT